MKKPNVSHQFSCLAIAGILIVLIFLSSTISFAQEQEDIKYDFSNFEPMSPEKFIERNFSYLKEYYAKDPSSISKGIFVTVQQPPEGSSRRYKTRAVVTQLYTELVENAIYEWAQISGYDIAYTVYGGAEGFTIVQEWNGKYTPSIRHQRHVSHRSVDKTIEEVFREENNYTGEVSLKGDRRWLSSIKGIPASFSIGRSITDSRDSEMRKQKIFRPDRDAPKSEWLDYFTSNSNNYYGSIGLMDSKYGSWVGSISNYSEKDPVDGSLDPVEVMLASVLGFCEVKIAEAQTLFIKKMGLDVEVEDENVDNDKGEEFVEKENQEIDQKPVASFSLSKRWIINQHWGSTGWKGKINLHQTHSGRFTGTATWDRFENGKERHESGTIDGQILGHNIEFTISYPSGVKGVYTGTLAQDGTKINGTATDPDTGYSNTWDASLQTKEDTKGDEILTEIVCASAKPSITSGSEFKRAKFNIGGSEPQEIKITSSAENFAIVKEYGGLVYQMIDGKSWGSTILEPGTYILSCNGGGAMGLMSATACIKIPSAGKILPPDVPPVVPRPDRDEDTTLEDSKPPLPKGPIEKIFVRSADGNNSDHLIMLIGEEKGIAVWGVDAGGNEQNVSVDDWKVYDEDIGWITKGLHNPASKDAPMKIKFKAGNKKGYTRIKATVINEENRRISGVLSIEVTKDPPITVTGCVKLYDENGNPLNAGGVKVNLDATWHENRQAHDQVVNWMEIPRQDKEIKTDRNGNFKFVVAMNGEFVSINCGLRYVLSAPPGYKWDSTPSDKGDFDDAEWKGSVKPGDTIPMVQSSYGCLSNFLKKMPITYYIGGKVIHRGKPVEGAKIKLVSNGKTFEDDKSRYNGQYWLDVGNLPKGTYILTADYKPIDESKEASPENTITLSNWLTMRNKIMVDLPLPTQEETIPINLISWKDKIGYTGP